MTKKIVKIIKGGCIIKDDKDDALSDLLTDSITEIKDKDKVKPTVTIDYNKFLNNLIWGCDEGCNTVEEFMDEDSKYNQAQKKRKK